MPETGNDASLSDISRQYRVPYKASPRRSYYGDAFHTEGESAYRRLQHDVAQSGVQDQSESAVTPQQNFTPVAAKQPAYRSTQVRSSRASAPDSSSAYRRVKTTQTPRSSLRRETVSAIGYEPGQSSRPSSFVHETPVDTEYSSLGTVGSANRSSWRSTGQEKMPSVGSARPTLGVFVGAAVAIVVVVLVALFAMRIGG